MQKQNDTSPDIQIWMNDWLQRTTGPTLEDNLRCVKGLPGIRQAFVLPDSAPDELGIPNGIVFEAPVEEAYVYPAALSDPNCGYTLVKLGLNLADLDRREARQLGWRFIHHTLNLAKQPPAFDLDLGRVFAEGARYLDEVLGPLEVAPGGVREDDGTLLASDTDVPEALHENFRRDFFRLLHFGHFSEINVVDTVWSPADLTAAGLEEGDLVLVIHDGSARAGLEFFLHFHEAVSVQAAREGVIDAHLIKTGAGGVPFLSALGQAFYRGVLAVENFAYARRRYLLWLVTRSLGDIFGKTLRPELLSDRPHTKLEVLTSDDGQRVVLRHGAQSVIRGLAAVCSRPAVPNILVAGAERGKRPYCPHGAANSPYLRGEMSYEDWKRLTDQPEVAVTNSQQCMWDALRERPTALHLAFQNVLDAVESVEQKGVVRRVARLWPFANITGTPKLLEQEEALVG